MNEPSHPYLDWEGPIAFAHRGGASEAPENTMPAFQYAIDLGFRYLETDVQVTADGVLAAFHDNNLRRTTGVDRKISAMTWDEVQQAEVRGPHGDNSAPIPQLEEILTTWPQARVNIDCKTDAAVDALVSVIQRTRSIDRVCIGAFSDLRLKKIRQRLGPGVCTTMGPAAVAALVYGRLRRSAAQTAQVPVRYGKIPVTTPKVIGRAHDMGVAVHVWTIDETAEMNRLLDLGVDGIMTDQPARLRDVFSERGIWQQ